MSYFVFFCWLGGTGLITSVGEERANLSAIIAIYCLLVIMWFLLERFHLPLGAWDRLPFHILNNG